MTSLLVDVTSLGTSLLAVVVVDVDNVVVGNAVTNFGAGFSSKLLPRRSVSGTDEMTDGGGGLGVSFMAGW